MQHVHRPICRVINYDAAENADTLSHHGLEALRTALDRTTLSISQEMSSDPSCEQQAIQGAHLAFRKLYEKSRYVLTELGSCAANFFIRETVKTFRVQTQCPSKLQMDHPDRATELLLRMFDELRIDQVCHGNNSKFQNISPKVISLLDYLLEDPEDSMRGIVFVTQRVVAKILSLIINDPRHARGRLRCVHNVGLSNISQRTFTLTDLITRRAQREGLSSFRDGKSNIIVATSVLEEGIDVQACNVVACFDLPPNLTSYIQRRGRARHQSSRYAILANADTDAAKVVQWRKIEADLTERYQEDHRQAEIYSALESYEEPVSYVLETTKYVTGTFSAVIYPEYLFETHFKHVAGHE